MQQKLVVCFAMVSWPKRPQFLQNLQKIQLFDTLALVMVTIMKTKSLMLFGAIAGLVSACGGSDTSVLPFFVEAESAGAARNGLSFATESTPADFTQVGPGDSFKIRFVGTRKAQQVGMPEFLTSVETLTLTEKPSGLFRYDGLMTYRGETFSMDIGPSGDVFDGFGTLSDGRYYNMELGTGAAHSGSMFVTFGTNTLEEYSIAARGNFVIGFETDPDVLPDLTGTATFNVIVPYECVSPR